MERASHQSNSLVVEKPLSPSFRAALRRVGEAVDCSPYIQSSAHRSICRRLHGFADGAEKRLLLAIEVGVGDESLPTAGHALEETLAARYEKGDRTKLLPIQIGIADLENTPARLDAVVGFIAKRTALEAMNEVVECAVANSPQDAVAQAAIPNLWRALRGATTLRTLTTLRTTLAGLKQPTDRIRYESDVLWQGLKLRMNRFAHDPSPWLRAEMDERTREIEEAHKRERDSLRTALRKNEGQTMLLGTILVLSLLQGAAGQWMDKLAFPAEAILAVVLALGLTYSLWHGRRQTHATEISLQLDQPLNEGEAGRVSNDLMPKDGAREPQELLDALNRFVGDMERCDLLPVFVFDARLLGRKHQGEGAGLGFWVQSLPSRSAALFCLSDGEEVSELQGFESVETLKGGPTLDARHSFAASYLAKGRESDVSLLDEGVLTLALVQASNGYTQRLRRFLREGYLGAHPLNAPRARDVMALRIRATLEMAVCCILESMKTERALESSFIMLAEVALRLLGEQWANGLAPASDKASVAQYMRAQGLSDAWDGLTTDERSRIVSGVKRCRQLVSQRAGLGSMLGVAHKPLSNIIPDVALIMEDSDGRLCWTFGVNGDVAQASSHGNGNEPSRHDERRTRTADSLFDTARRLEFEHPRPGDRIPTNGPATQRVDFLMTALGGFVPARKTDSVHAAPAEKPMALRSVVPFETFDESVDEGPPSWDEEESAMGGDEPTSLMPLATVTDHDAANLVEVVDALIAQVARGGMTLVTLSEVGILPGVPSPLRLTEALEDFAEPEGRYMLAEATMRLHERLGVLEKFLIWFTALRALLPRQIDEVQLASALIQHRGLRGLPALEQHSLLSWRGLRADLRKVCPDADNLKSIFVRTKTPRYDLDELRAWGSSLLERCGRLESALSGQLKHDVLKETAWASLRERFTLLARYDEVTCPTFAETLARLSGLQIHQNCPWSGGRPSVHALSKVLSLGASRMLPADAEDLFWAAGIALGLNGVQLNILCPDYPKPQREELIEGLASGTTRPLVLIVNSPSTQAICDSPVSRDVAAVVLSPDDVQWITSLESAAVIVPSNRMNIEQLRTREIVRRRTGWVDLEDALTWWRTHGGRRP